MSEGRKAGFNFGIKKTLPLILGVGFGYTALIILINFVLISTFENYPIIQEVIRILGTFFLIYLAYKISFSKISSDGKTENPVKFLDSIYKQSESTIIRREEFQEMKNMILDIETKLNTLLALDVKDKLENIIETEEDDLPF